jgi:hypothetical protein
LNPLRLPIPPLRLAVCPLTLVLRFLRIEAKVMRPGTAVRIGGGEAISRTR